MGKTTGFLEYTRAEAGHREPLRRIHDYDPYLIPCSEEFVHVQSARCMDCGVPFCHAGIQATKGSIGCPLGSLIPEINDLAYRGEWDEAYRRLVLRHPFPEITGRVCPALCEGSCVEGNYSEAVAIRDIERTLADHGLARGLEPQRTARPSGKTVAVVGSGPAGMAAAYTLSFLGHRVRVYERDDRPGGLLVYGIPNMKLEKSIIDQRVALLEAQGVEFSCNCEIGKDLGIEQLTEGHHAVVLCIGARAERHIQVPGSDARGVVPALEYLTAATRHLLDGTAVEGRLNAHGKDVVVLGGGDTSTDCVATAIRQGASSVAVLRKSPALPSKRAADNPWPLWPRVSASDYGQEEALARFGRDVYEHGTDVKEILQEGGRCTGVVSATVSWERDENGRLAATELPQTCAARQADLVLIAKGFVGVESALPQSMQLEVTSRGTIATAAGAAGAARGSLGTATGAIAASAGIVGPTPGISATPAGANVCIAADGALEGRGYATHLPGVFVAGDARRGPSLVVWAIREGMQAGQACDGFLRSSGSQDIG